MIWPAQNITQLSEKIELLAPAGRADALEAVIAAGADAVYLGTKQFSMRRHRGDFHFDADGLMHAVRLVHDAGRRIYVTVNALIGESELTRVTELLRELDRLEVDAIIVQDLATVHIARQLDLRAPLHASTMMNVHCSEHASVLKALGISRVITSRDIPLSTIGQIGREAGVEVECFVHGDMCVAHGGQCNMSGVLFGKSANRGECMKPCRWDYDLVNLDTADAIGAVSNGHLLALKDLCLIRHIPDVVQAGIHCMKIEGRMRDAAYLGQLVESYRKAIDSYYACPPSFQLSIDAIEGVYKNQVRQLSTLTILGGASHRGAIDTSGRREPLQLSNGLREDETTAPVAIESDPQVASAAARAMSLSVCVSDAEGARAAIRGGASRIYFAAELSQFGGGAWSHDALLDVMREAQQLGVTVGLRTPRVTTAREWAETRWLLSQMVGRRLDHVLVHHPGTLRLARQILPEVAVIADFGFNVLNSAAVAMLGELGVSEVCVSNEAGVDETLAMAANSSLPLEVMAHGQVLGMLIDHCVIALHGSSAGRKDVCRGPCKHVQFGLRDKADQVRLIIADQHCRNHLMTGRDVAALPILTSLCTRGITSIRIEMPYDTPQAIADVTAVYRNALNAIAEGDTSSLPIMVEQLKRIAPRAFNLGPFAQSIVNSRSTATVMKNARKHREIA